MIAGRFEAPRSLLREIFEVQGGKGAQFPCCSLAPQQAAGQALAMHFQVFWIVWMIFSVFPVLAYAEGLSSNTVYDCDAEENRNKPATVEIVLSQKWKDRVQEVKASVQSSDAAVKVRVRFLPFLDPPTNIGVGKCVSADVARRAIQEAIHYSGKIDRLIRQDILPHHWIKIGSTDTAELAWIPVGPDDLTRLTDPSLSNEQFQELYRSLAEPKARHLPFGMGSQPIQEAPPR